MKLAVLANLTIFSYFNKCLFCANCIYVVCSQLDYNYLFYCTGQLQ